ncbi:aldehyde dehydrogenase family protein [Symbiopectobacterium purcellii]|uniref:aldehyde dehydrogenase family protein n=1 Tax=Symbiopectobacterium purcellii TaxID=2871826 RepID=UPI003F8285F0
MGYATINPYTGEVIKTFPDATDAEVTDAISQAHNAFLAWKETPFSTRGAILQKAATLLRQHKEEMARLLTLEMGKLVAEARAEVELSAQIFEYYVKHAEGLLAPETLPVANPKEANRADRARTAGRAARYRAVEFPLLSDRSHHRTATFCR